MPSPEDTPTYPSREASLSVSAVCAVSGSVAAGGMFYLLQILLKLGYVAVKLRLFALLFGAVVGLFLLFWLISTVIAAVCACRRAFFFRKGVLANFFAIAVLAF